MPTLQIPVAKGGKGCVLPVESDYFNELTPDQQLEIIAAGLETLCNKRMSSAKDFPAPSKLTGEEAETAKANALAKAQANLDDFALGELHMKTTSKASKEPQAVMTEAIRQAKEVVKNELRRAKVKISLVKASEITTYAKQLVADDPSFIQSAKVELEKRASVKPIIDLSGLKEDPKLKAKAEAEKAKAKEVLSAKQAGLPTPRQGGKGPKPIPSRQQAEARHQAH